MTTHVSDIQLRDFNPQGREEWLTRAINYLRSYPNISEATCVNLLYKKLPIEDRILLDMMRGTATLEKAEEVLRKKYASSQMSDVQVALSGMHLASNELPSEMLRITLKAHLSVPIMNVGLDWLVKVLFLQALPPEADLKFSGYSGTTQQLVNEADSYVITLRQEKQHKLPFSVATNKQDPAVIEHGNPYEMGALSVLFSARSQVLIENCALLLILAKRIPIMKNTGPELSIVTVTTVRAINVGVKTE